MSNADIFVEMVRLAEQIGEIEDAHMFPTDYLTVCGKTKDGKKFNLTVSIMEEKKDGN